MKNTQLEKLLPWLESLLYVIMGVSAVGFVALAAGDKGPYAAAVWPLIAMQWFHKCRKQEEQIRKERKEQLRFLSSITEQLERLNKE